MDNKKLLLAPLLIGMALLIHSWFVSYPITINYANDYVFNHISVSYWFGLAFLFPSMYLIAATSKNIYLKWIMTVGIVLALYSTSFYFYRLSTSDSYFYRGLHEFFAHTGNLDSSLPGKVYFQWPAVFVLTNVATTVSGLQLENFEFLMYAIIGIMLATSLFLFTTKPYKNGGFLAAVVFFIGMYYYLNYQFAAFTIAFLFLLLALVLENEKKTSGKLPIIILLFIGMTLSHAYVAVFYIIFLCIKTIISKDKQYRDLFFLTLITYLLYQLTLTNNAIDSYVMQLTQLDTNISGLPGLSITPVVVPIDAIAQRILSIELITTIMICGIGFLILLLKRKTRNFDKAIFLTGLGYFIFGLIFWVLGQRAIPLAFIPVSLGASYLFESKIKKFLAGVFLILIIILFFVPLHGSFFNTYNFSQTKEAYNAEHFMLENYNWTSGGIFVAHSPIIEYFRSNLGLKEAIGTYLESDDFLKVPRFNEYTSILYTVGLENRLSVALASYNYTIESKLHSGDYNIVYDNGASSVYLRVI